MRTPTLLLTLACTLVACGGDGGGPVDSGVTPTKTGSTLTADEQDKICKAIVANLESQNTDAERKEFACVAQGIAFAALGDNTPAQCEQLAKMCRDGAGEDGNDDGGGTQMCNTDFSTCAATVAEIEACATEKNEAFGRAVREASCDDVGKMPSEPVTGPECTKIKTTCPAVSG